MSIYCILSLCAALHEEGPTAFKYFFSVIAHSPVFSPALFRLNQLLVFSSRTVQGFSSFYGALHLFNVGGFETHSLRSGENESVLDV